jgi:subtilisin family serine protease
VVRWRGGAAVGTVVRIDDSVVAHRKEGAVRRGFLLSAALLTAAVPVVGSLADAAPATESGFIVVLEPSSVDVDVTAAQVAATVGEQVDSVYEYALDGFSVTATEAEAAALANNPLVAYVEPNVPFTVEAQTVSTGASRVGAATNPAITINGIDDIRVDVDVAIIDSGIDLQHPDLNVAGSVNCLLPGPLSGCQAGGDDDLNHGTHVAGIVGALDNGQGVVGVAPGARLWAVKVIDAGASGTLESVLRGVDWVTANAATIEVANMSLGVDQFSQVLFDGIQAAVNQGVVVVASAGNAFVNAAPYSPAGFSNVITVSALADFDGLPGGLGAPTCAGDIDDTLASFSNFGSVIDIAAPGMCILSTLPLEQGGYGVANGTSMAAPHVAGAAALLARVNNPSSAAGVAAIANQLYSKGNLSYTDDSGDGVKEPLLDMSDAAVFNAGLTCVVPVADVVGWWRGEDSLAAAAGTPLTGATAYSTGMVGRAFSMSSTSSLAAAGVAAVSAGVTVEGWFRPVNDGRLRTLISRWNFPSTDDTARAFELTLQPNGDLVWATDETSTRRPEELRVAAPTLTNGAFHHVAATWDRTSFSIYLDGVRIATKPSQGGVLNAASSVPVRVGGEGVTGSSFPFTGDIDEVSVWRRALTTAEVQSIVAAGAAGKCGA